MVHNAEIKEIKIDEHEIVEILANSKLFCDNWQNFCKILKFKNADVYDLQRLFNSHAPITEIILKILNHWRSIDPDDANIKCLPAKLRQIGCIECAKDIENRCKNNFGNNIGKTAQNSDNIVEVLHLETLAANLHSRQGNEGPKVWFNIREPTTYYLGRENEMKIIEDQFKFCLDKKSMMVVAITGLGGIGKTEISRNYAKNFYENVKGHCIWLDAETDASLKQSLQDLSKNTFNLTLKDDLGREKSVEILLGEIYRKISGKISLIVFDNLESYENSILLSLSGLALKDSPEIIKPFVITTSRFRWAKKFFGNKCVHLELDVLEKESAVEFFTKSFNAKKHLQHISYLETVGLLCGRLQCYPLAMQQAAAYVNGNLSNSPDALTLTKEIEKYLEKLEKEAKNLLDHKLPQFEVLESHSRTTLLTWRITLQKIMETPGNGVEAIGLMNIISFMSPDKIAMDFLINLFRRIEGQRTRKQFVINMYLQFAKMLNAIFSTENEHTNRKDSSFELLRSHSMIKISEDKISIHRLVQEITRIELQERGEFILTLDKMVQCMEKMLEDKEVSLDQLIHVQAVWEFAIKTPEMIEKYPDFAADINNKLYSSGRYQDSLDFSCRAVMELESILGEENRSTLKMCYWKGLAMHQLADYKASLSLFLDVHWKQKELFGEDDDYCLLTARAIGRVYYRLHNSKEAIKWCEDALEKREKVSGKEHNETLDLKHSLALALKGQGKNKEAMKLYKEVLEVDERLLGKTHPDTLCTKHSIACILFQEIKFEEALKMFQEILDVREKVLELNHPHTLNTKDMIASTFKSLGRGEEALQLAEEVYDKRKKILGPHHPRTIASFNILEVLK